MLEGWIGPGYGHPTPEGGAATASPAPCRVTPGTPRSAGGSVAPGVTGYHHDPVGVPHRREAVGDHEGGPPA